MTKNKTYKHIAYCYPTSANAKKLGKYYEGCFTIIKTILDENGEIIFNGMIDGIGAFDRPDDECLIESFLQESGDICPHFLKHGDTQALRAIES